MAYVAKPDHQPTRPIPFPQLRHATLPSHGKMSRVHEDSDHRWSVSRLHVV